MTPQFLSPPSHRSNGYSQPPGRPLLSVFFPERRVTNLPRGNLLADLVSKSDVPLRHLPWLSNENRLTLANHSPFSPLESLPLGTTPPRPETHKDRTGQALDVFKVLTSFITSSSSHGSALRSSRCSPFFQRGYHCVCALTLHWQLIYSQPARFGTLLTAQLSHQILSPPFCRCGYGMYGFLPGTPS